GNFDGLHVGHQQLLKVLRQSAIEHKAPAAVISFEPQPPEFFKPDLARPRLMRFKEKWHFLARQKIDYFICLHFDKLLARCNATEFVETILIKQLGVKAVIVGDNFRFGADRTGDISLLEKLALQYHFKLIIIPQMVMDGERISSTRVRNALQSNQLNLAARLLGHAYFLHGKVIHGDARGHQWGFPTANIDLTGKPIPITGVFVVQVLGIAETALPAVASIGVRPMFANGRTLLEVHVLDFNADLYGRKLTVEFLHKLRDQQVFINTAQLINQINLDVQNAREYFVSTILSV
ncbi:MAG: bifunctional riboflavin kinase/FAD synthetase, partial [Proteobacteria bacterium]|nr:bifunctional riboflavin kinase/FAD synthetase [Pseudomonadota bacterium]